MRFTRVLPACLLTASVAVSACTADPTDPPMVPSFAGGSTVAAVVVEPDSQLVIAGDVATFTGRSLNAAGQTLTTAVNWSIQKPSLVTVLSRSATALRLRAAKPGITTIRGTAKPAADTATLVIRTAAGARLVLSSHAVTLAPLATAQFEVVGITKAGDTATVTSTWSATGGTVSASGVYTAGRVAGTYRVVATAPFGAADTAVVTITPSPIVALVVTPDSVTLSPGETQQFTVYGRNALGDSTDAAVAWTATGGSIGAGGSYTAGSTPGAWQVTATLAGDTLSATGSVTVPEPGGTGGGGIPFGLWGMTGRKLVDPYTSAMQPAQPDTILLDLAAARARGARIVVNFTGGATTNVTDSVGHFDYGRWKARLDRFLPIVDQLNAYVSDGTLLAYLMIDEPFATNTWGGQAVPRATLDQMAQYSKSLFPELATAVRAAPSELQGYPWQYLDVSWAQYTVKKGPIDSYVQAQVSAARGQGLGLVVGLNISKGGDGSSGNGTTDAWSMSGAEILAYGRPMLDDPYPCAFISWDNRSSVITRTDVAAALQELATAAAAHAASACRR
ncbi:MAG TPA: hypothetical protein VF046_00900 [Gemmatimonadales bacterium]